jgi:hypothetical protein
MTELRQAIATVEALHYDVDRRCESIAAVHGDRLLCARGCFDCCIDDITVFVVEAEIIRLRYPELLEFAEPHPPGRCSFLGPEGECRIYDARPYACRTQGLPLRWFEVDEAEYRDICPLNDEGPPIVELPEEQCWTIGPYEDALRRVQAALDGGAPHRVALRDLFIR